MAEYIGENDEFDPSSAVAEAEVLCYRYEVLVASFSSKINHSLIVLTSILAAIVLSALFYFYRPDFTFGSDFRELLPSLWIVLLFSLISTFRYLGILRSARWEAHVALSKQHSMLRRTLDEMELGGRP